MLHNKNLSRKKMQIDIPSGVRRVITQIRNEGYQAHAVGGCVRDSLLGKSPKDWDITTSANPEEIMNIFKSNRTIPTGLKHGTVTVLESNNFFEVTTYRIDGDYADGRHAENVFFTDSLKEDLNRRDFTINAMAYNDEDGLIDYFGGTEDLYNKTVRCVGDADMRFSEDYLRMLRAYRFAVTLDFRLEESLVESCVKNRNKILDISAERIRSELDKILVCDNFNMIKVFLDDFSDVILPELFGLKGIGQNNPYHCFDVYDHTFEVLKNTPDELDMRLAALFHDMGKKSTKTTDSKGVDHFKGHPQISADIAMDIMKRLKYDNKTMACVNDLIKAHDERIKPERKNIRSLINKLGKETALKLLKFQYADIMGQSDYSKEINLPLLKQNIKLYDEIIAAKDPCSIKELSVSGKDIINILNIKQGERIGEILNFLLDKVMENPDLNKKEKLIDLMKEKFI